MANITVFLNGLKVIEKDLDPTQEYIIGRGSSADIILENNEISRNHAKLKCEEGIWICEVMSKYGRLFLDGSGVESLSLTNGSRFQIPPFEIKFDSASENLQEKISYQDSHENPEVLSSDKTHTGVTNLKAVLLRLDATGEAIEEITLGEGECEAGRSRACQIHLGDEKASRKHFKIKNDGKSILLTDLGSPNQTYVNGAPINSHLLQSGDEIQVGKEKLRFEFLNVAFENLLPMDSEHTGELPEVNPEETGEYSQPAVIKFAAEQGLALWNEQGEIQKQQRNMNGMTLNAPDQHQLRTKKNAKNPLFLVVLTLAIITALYFALLPEAKKQATERQVAGTLAKSSDGPQYDRLGIEQKKYLEDTYNLAMNLYTSGKYDLAALEVDKILRIIPNFRDAKNIQALAQQALEIKKQKDETDRQLRDQEAIARKVNDILDDCDRMLGQKKYSEVESCVARVSDMDPNSARGESLVTAAKDEMAKKEHTKAAIAEKSRKKALAVAAFNRAQLDLSQKRYPAAIETFSKIEQMSFADTDGLKQKSKLGIQAARQKIIESSDLAFREGKVAYDAKDYKKTILKMIEALKLYGQNGDAKIIREKAESELHIEMKNIYSESVIDENLGNVEPAKKKWHQILEQDTTFDTYYDKAKMKLSKYEK